MSKPKRKDSTISDVRTDTDECQEFDNLPKEIIAEIMIRLPPESLMRIKCLNKSWYFVILCLVNDQNFVSKHHRHAEKYPTVLLVNEPPLFRRCRLLQIHWDTNRFVSKLRLLQIRKEDLILRPQRIFSMFITKFVDYGDERDKKNGTIGCETKDVDVSHLPGCIVRQIGFSKVLVYHCNGIVCLTKDCKSMTLFNPKIGEFGTCNPNSSDGIREIPTRMGFGSDREAKTFKIVRILDSMKAQVLTIGITHSWREVKLTVLLGNYNVLPESVYMKGCCFWLVEGKPNVILCFDVLSEVFQVISLPLRLDLRDLKFCSLAVCDNSLYFFSKNCTDTYMWVMDFYEGFSYSWGKGQKIECSGSPLTFVSRNELLLKTSDGGDVLYNFCTKNHKKLSISGKLGKIYYMDHYVNSLASVKWMMKHVPRRSI